MILNERLLHVFITLAEELHFGRAAAALHMSQPALSGALKGLETDLGARLFDRTSRTVALTPAGKVLLVEARRLVNESQRAVTLVRSAATDIIGPLQVGYDPCINLSWLGSVIADIRRLPGVQGRTNFMGGGMASLQQDLLQRKLNVALFAGNEGGPEFHYVPLFSEALHLVTSSVAEWRGLPFVCLAEQAHPHLYRKFLEACTSLEYQPKGVQQVGSFFECLQLAREGLGVTFLPASMNSNLGNQSMRLLAQPQPAFQIDYVIGHLTDVLPRSVQQLVQFLCNHAEKRSRQLAGVAAG